jgi:UDP-N-acetylmuramate dehydrogenase
VELFRNVGLAELTSIGVGGRADYLAFPESPEDVRKAVLFAREKDIPLYVLGGGSNTIFGDIRGLVLSTEKLSGWDFIEENGKLVVRVLSGTPLKEVVNLSLKKNLSDIYKLLGFPASVGGAVAMNAGAFGVEISSFLKRVLFMDWDGNMIEADATDLRFSYRSSPFPELGILISCTFELKPSQKPVLEEFKRIRSLRKNTQPINRPTSGSTFKNPYPMYAGELLERVGMKGYRVGGVSFSRKHANFLINHGGGSFKDVIGLIGEAKRRVWEEFGVHLEEEVRLIESGGHNGWEVL